VADFFEARALRQVVDVVAAVGEATVLAVEVAELGLGGDDPSSPRMSWLPSLSIPRPLGR
jgi:hypothetical protein